MRSLAGLGIRGLVLAGLLWLPCASLAQDQKGPQAAAGAAGSGWAAKSTSPGTNELILDPKQLEMVKRISGYFSDLNNLRGVFVQTDPDKKRSRGRFFVKRPGKFRFDYGAPSRKVMASDGQMLRIQDPDQATPESYQLDNTPFRLLLKKDVDLLRDARILDVQDADDLVILTIQDKSPDAPGRVRLFFAKKPAFDLKEWVVFDAQGLETRVEISELNKTDEIDPKIFVWETSFFKN